MFVSEPLHPPLAVADVLNVAHAASTAAWVLHAGSVTLVPHEIVAGAAVDAVTVKVLVHVFGASQLEV